MSEIRYILFMVVGASFIFKDSFAGHKNRTQIETLIHYMYTLKSSYVVPADEDSFQEDLFRKSFARHLLMRAYTVYLTCYLYSQTQPKPSGESPADLIKDSLLGGRIPRAMGQQCRSNTQRIHELMVTIRGYEIYEGLTLKEVIEMVTDLENIIIPLHVRLSWGEAHNVLFAAVFPDERNIVRVLQSNHKELHDRITIPYEMKDVKLFHYFATHFNVSLIEDFMQHPTMEQALQMWEHRERGSKAMAAVLYEQGFSNPTTRDGQFATVLYDVLKANNIYLYEKNLKQELYIIFSKNKFTKK